jgi:nucleoside-diphosphate-sugar epimerase
MSKMKIEVEIATRVFADLIIVNASLMMSLVPELLSRHAAPFSLLDKWWPSACLVSALGPLLFYSMGFYTKGRFYTGKYKALIVTQGAALLFLLLALALYFFRLQPSFPRSSLLFAWCGASVLLVTARLWADLWRRVVIRENNESVVVTRNPKHVLVIGGAGYVGSALIPKVLDRGYRVRLLDCFLYGRDPIKPFMQHPNLETHQGDFRNVDTVVAAMRDVDSVIHLGAIVGDPACALDEELTIQINLIATRMIAQVAKGNGISRFVFASSCSVYGASDQLLDERSALNPVSLYARSKIASENVLMSFRGDGFEPVILRFGTIYGLSGRTRFDLVVNLLAAKALVDKVVTVFGKDQWRPFLHVHDASRSVLTALDAPSQAVAPVIFNVGCNEQNRTLGQVGELITTMVPGSVLHCTEENVDRRNYRVDFQRIREGLGFQPVWTIEAGVQQVLDAMRSGKIVDYQDARYSNVKFLSAPNVRVHLPVIEDWVAECLSQSGATQAANA